MRVVVQLILGCVFLTVIPQSAVCPPLAIDGVSSDDPLREAWEQGSRSDSLLHQATRSEGWETVSIYNMIPTGDPLLTDEEILAARKTFYLAKYEREIEKLRDSRRTVGWANRMGIVTFIFVHLLLVLAVFAAAREFIRAGKAGAHGSTEHEVVVSASKIALRTSMHGTALIVLAMGFYYLYLEYVLPISVIR